MTQSIKTIATRTFTGTAALLLLLPEPAASITAGITGAAVGGAAGYMSAVILCIIAAADSSKKNPAPGELKFCQCVGLIGAAIGYESGRLVFDSMALIAAMITKTIAYASQDKVNLSTKQLILAGAGAYTLFKTAQWATPVIHDTIFGVTPNDHSNSP